MDARRHPEASLNIRIWLHSRRAHAPAAAAVLLGVLLSMPARATTIVKVDNVDLAHIADVIVIGEVVSVKMQTEPMTPAIFKPTIRTHNAVKVIETWKGDAKPGDVLDVIEPGGFVDGNGFDMVGSCGYEVGERVLLFLEPKKQSSGWLTLGMMEGKYTLLPDGKGGFGLAQHYWKMEERGHAFEAASVPRSALKEGEGFELESLSALVKKTAAADKKLGVRGRDLPQYVGKVAR
jgi:hypothetical protein